MSKYTTQLRWLVDHLGDGLPVPEGQQYANNVYKGIGLDRYPIFDEAYRATLNDKIINHFYFREIGFETAAQFAWYMKQTMWEVMPKYNRLYRALETDLQHPLSDWYRHRTVDDDLVSNVEGSTHSENESETSSTDRNRNVYQDTPMSILSNEGAPSVEGLDYATSVTYDDGSGTTSGTSASDGKSTTDRVDNRDRVEDEYGRNKSLASLIEEFDEKFQDIDVLVINSLNDLFLKLW